MPLTAGEGFWAEVEVGELRLRLVCVETGFGIASNVYRFKDQRWVDTAPMWVETFDQGKQIAEGKARRYLDQANRSKLPAVTWISTAAAATQGDSGIPALNKR